MIRRSFVLSAAGLSLALAGCGGGGDSSPTPTPTPTSTPTPTPTPVTYSAFPLTAAAEFGTIDAFASFSGDLGAGGTVILGPAGTETGSTRFRLAILADPSTATDALPQVVRENTEEVRYAAAALNPAPATTVKEYTFSTTGTGGAFSTTDFLNNTVKDKITTDTGLALTSVSYAGWYRGDATPTGGTPILPKRLTYGVFGYPTVSSDLPTTGTVSYTARIAGRIVGAGAAGAGGRVDKLGGTVAITVNFATGLVTATLNVTVIGTGGAETPFGTFSGTGAIASGATQFTGSFGPSSPIPGTFAGAFFGSQGKEIGISFAGSGNAVLGGTTYDTRAVGVVVGKKN